MNISVNAYGNVVFNHRYCQWTLTPEESLQVFNELAKYHQPKPIISVELDYLKEFVNGVVNPEIFFDGSILYNIKDFRGSGFVDQVVASKEAAKYVESVVRDNMIKKIEAHA
jgi:hypothetical protein